jgi:drug/metabolite transporter (DMT)-like permease
MPVSPYILLALTSLFWSLNFIIGKIVSSLIPPTTVNFLRWLLPFPFPAGLSILEQRPEKGLGKPGRNLPLSDPRLYNGHLHSLSGRETQVVSNPRRLAYLCRRVARNQ